MPLAWRPIETEDSGCKYRNADQHTHTHTSEDQRERNLARLQVTNPPNDFEGEPELDSAKLRATEDDNDANRCGSPRCGAARCPKYRLGPVPCLTSQHMLCQTRRSPFLSCPPKFAPSEGLLGETHTAMPAMPATRKRTLRNRVVFLRDAREHEWRNAVDECQHQQTRWSERGPSWLGRDHGRMW